VPSRAPLPIADRPLSLAVTPAVAARPGLESEWEVQGACSGSVLGPTLVDEVATTGPPSAAASAATRLDGSVAMWAPIYHRSFRMPGTRHVVASAVHSGHRGQSSPITPAAPGRPGPPVVPFALARQRSPADLCYPHRKARHFMRPLRWPGVGTRRPRRRRTFLRRQIAAVADRRRP
jgi:hypothetical protein